MKIIPTSVASKFSRQVLVSQKHAPKILFIAGVVGVIGSTVLACKATLKVGPVLDELKFDLDEIAKIKPHITEKESGYTKKLHNKNLAYVYGKHGGKVIRLYTPAIIVGGVSIAALTSSHVVLSRRNASLTAAYSALQASYDAYRDRVREELGEEKELDIYQNATVKKVLVDGKETNVKVVDPTKHSIYARFFDEASPHWQKDPEVNKLFVMCQQKYATDLLHARGHVFLNEVYESLGIDHSQAGAVVGWVLGNGDNFVDFGIFDVNKQNNAFVNGIERSILLDFNVDGVILDKI